MVFYSSFLIRLELVTFNSRTVLNIPERSDNLLNKDTRLLITVSRINFGLSRVSLSGRESDPLFFKRLKSTILVFSL